VSYTKIPASTIRAEYDLDGDISIWIASKMLTSETSYAYFVIGTEMWSLIGTFFREDDPINDPMFEVAGSPIASPEIEEHIYCEEAGKGVLFYLAHEMMSLSEYYNFRSASELSNSPYSSADEYQKDDSWPGPTNASAGPAHFRGVLMSYLIQPAILSIFDSMATYSSSSETVTMKTKDDGTPYDFRKKGDLYAAMSDIGAQAGYNEDNPVPDGSDWLDRVMATIDAALDKVGIVEEETAATKSLADYIIANMSDIDAGPVPPPKDPPDPNAPAATPLKKPEPGTMDPETDKVIPVDKADWAENLSIADIMVGGWMLTEKGDAIDPNNPPPGPVIKFFDTAVKAALVKYYTTMPLAPADDVSLLHAAIDDDPEGVLAPESWPWNEIVDDADRADSIQTMKDKLTDILTAIHDDLTGTLVADITAGSVDDGTPPGFGASPVPTPGAPPATAIMPTNTQPVVDPMDALPKLGKCFVQYCVSQLPIADMRIGGMPGDVVAETVADA
jgi:hypothetical protein